MQPNHHASFWRRSGGWTGGARRWLAPLLAGVVLTQGFSADPRFGVMTHFAQGWDPALAQTIANGAVLRVRDELYWDQIEAKKGVFKWPANFDQYLSALNSQGISPLIVLSFENPNYDGGQTPYTPAGFAAYARYAVEVLRHCGPNVKAVEIWNEYNGTFNHGPASTDRTATYLKMLKVAYAAIKAERPDVTVVAGATAGIPFPYWEKLFKGGVLDNCDAISIHPYRYLERPEGMETEIADLRALMKRYGPEEPIWVSEIGWQLKGSQAPGDFAIDEEVQARFLVRSYALLLSAGVKNIYWYLFRDDPQFTMGLLRNDEARTPKLAYSAMNALSKHLQGAVFVRREATPEDMYSLLFRTSSGGEKRIMWNMGPRLTPLRGATTATDLYGKSLSLGGSVNLGFAPVLVNGPVRGLPSAPAAQPIIADSIHDFLLGTDQAWSYGFYVPGTRTFGPLPTLDLNDWEKFWTGVYPYISISPDEQHPSSVGPVGVAAVRRWRSDRDGKVRITGRFRCGTNGDGVGVSLVVDGQLRFRKLLNTSTDVVEEFDRTEDVHVGSAIDFAVDPGPGSQINYDVTSVSVVIRAQP